MGSWVAVGQHDERDIIKLAAVALVQGRVLVMPTDSVYGMGCAAFEGNPAHERIFEIKRREREQALPLLVADPGDLDRLGRDVPAWAGELAARFWPGALTLVVHATDAVPAEYRAPDGTVALRCPNSDLVRKIAHVVDMPLAVTSANTHGHSAPAKSGQLEVRIVDAVDLTLDAGPAPLGVASTIVSCLGDEPVILREGAIPASDILRLG